MDKVLLMKTSASLLLLFFVCSQLAVITESKSIQKRTIFQLCQMIHFYTNKSCVDYSDYGCFCGYGQEGRKPVDRVDACCKKHDNCYGRSSCFLYPQFVNIAFKCENGRCHCKDEWGTCRRDTCECEKSLAECFADSKYHYNFYHMDRAICK